MLNAYQRSFSAVVTGNDHKARAFLRALFLVVVFFIFIVYCGSLDFQCCLCFRYLGN